MTLRSLDDWFTNGSKPSDLKPGDRILVQVDMQTSYACTVEYWPFLVVLAPRVDHVMGKSLPKKVSDKLVVLATQYVMLDRARCLGPWRTASHHEEEPTCEMLDCLDFSHYTRSA